MKFTVGYQLSKDDKFISDIISFKEKLSEVYFSFPYIPNGRGKFNANLNELEYLKHLENDLSIISKEGISLNLLLNGLCFGRHSQSRSFFIKIGDTVDYLSNNYRLGSVTTTSPIIAKFMKENFSKLDVRASVNMEIGTIQSMEYISEYFDSFYAKRECNKDLKQLKKMREWCDSNGKKLYGLANSGCLNFCSTHIFHDNLVAHEEEIAEMDNAYQFEGQCRTYLKDSVKREKWLAVSNFIRPEDIGLYEDIFDGLKLATRVNKNPAIVLRAYVKESYNGNLPEIMEPDHSAVFFPNVIENKKIPTDFTLKTSTCDKNCNSCNYCKNILTNALICLK